MRGSDPDAALYWLAKMIHAGEDPRFITRRMVIAAAEDVGLADPMALDPGQCRAPSGGICRLARGAHSDCRSDDLRRDREQEQHEHHVDRCALDDVRSGRTLAVPEHLRDAHYKGAKRLGHGEGYQYAHDHPEHFVAQDYLGARRSVTTNRPSRASRRRSRNDWTNGGRRRRERERARNEF